MVSGPYAASSPFAGGDQGKMGRWFEGLTDA